MTQFTRRTFLKTSSLAAAALSLPYRTTTAQALADIAAAQDLRALTAAALDAAKGAGATYADVHFRLTRKEGWSFMGFDYGPPFLSTIAGFSVRALINGYWGFAGLDGIASMADAARLGRDAAAQARTAAKGKPRTVDLAPVSAVANGNWTMPIEIDPFTVSFEEKADFFTGISDFFARQRHGVGTQGGLSFLKEERAFASTDGAFATQTIYTTDGGLSIGVPADWLKEERGGVAADFLTPVGAGWEYIRKAPFQDRAAAMIDEALRSRRKKPVDVGRYDMVFDAQALARILSLTIGQATELDRAFGYEANTVGTSYISDPLEMLGTFKMGSPLLNVTANRSMSGGAATVKWDEEGVEPAEATLVKDGILNDFQTTREAASWISPYYQKSGMQLRSNGCAGQHSPTSNITQVTPNLRLAPAATDVSFDDMVKDTKKGLAIIGGNTNVDFQALNGTGRGSIVYEIVDGKLGSAIAGAQYLYRAPDFWKNLVAIGGKSSVRSYGIERGRFGGDAAHTVSAVPGKVIGIAVTDVMRKA